MEEIQNTGAGAAAEQTFTDNQQEAIQALIRNTLEMQGVQLEYEDFEGYEVPPRSQFSVMKRPAVSIKNGQMNFNMACIRLFKGAAHIVPLLNSDKKRLAVIPCVEEENASVEWARKKPKDGEWTNKTVTSRDFVDKIFQIMGWTKGNRYRVLGRLTNSERGLILVFELTEADEYEKVEGEVNPATGKARSRQKKNYPQELRDKVGRDYSEYRAAREQEGHETLDNYASVEAVLGESGVLVSEIPPEAVPETLQNTAREIEENANRTESEEREQA